MKYALTTLAAVALLGGGRLLENRWQGEFESVPVRLDQISHDLDGWHGIDLKLEGQQASWAQLGDGVNPGYLDREYVDPKTGRRIAVLLVWGRPDPVSVHTPDECYPGAGFAPVSEKKKEEVDAESPRPAAAFYTQDFSKGGPDGTRLRIFWAWNADGHWQAPDHPHEDLARHHQFYTYGGGVLFKLYVIREMTGDGDAADADTCRDFLRVLLPEFRRQLFPGT
jgi:hypothetical protein